MSKLVFAEHVVKERRVGRCTRTKKFASPDGFPTKLPWFRVLPDTTDPHARNSYEQAAGVGHGDGISEGESVGGNVG